MTPEELKAKVEELRVMIAEKLAELEEDSKWGSDEEREELGLALDELSVQAHSLSDVLQEEC